MAAIPAAALVDTERLVLVSADDEGSVDILDPGLGPREGVRMALFTRQPDTSRMVLKPLTDRSGARTVTTRPNWSPVPMDVRRILNSCPCSDISCPARHCSWPSRMTPIWIASSRPMCSPLTKNLACTEEAVYASASRAATVALHDNIVVLWVVVLSRY